MILSSFGSSPCTEARKSFAQRNNIAVVSPTIGKQLQSYCNSHTHTGNLEKYTADLQLECPLGSASGLPFYKETQEILKFFNGDALNPQEEKNMCQTSVSFE